MNTTVKDILIPLEQFPHVQSEAPVHEAVGLLFSHPNGHGRLQYDELLVISADNRAALIGVLSGTPENYGTALLDPALERLRAHVLLDPDFHPFEGADFSAWATRAS